MPEETVVPAPYSSTMLSRRAVIGAAAWSVPVLAVAMAVPAYAASGDTIDASGVVLTFTGPEWSSEFRLSGQLALSSAPVETTTVSATITWQGSGANSGAQGLYLYKGNIPGGDAGILGWNLVQGAADDSLHDTYVFHAAVAAGTAEVPTISSYDGSTANGFMFGAETAQAGATFWDGTITIRFSAPGYTDAVLTVPYVQ